MVSSEIGDQMGIGKKFLERKPLKNLSFNVLRYKNAAEINLEKHHMWTRNHSVSARTVRS